jgi:ribose transport system substrate-binding protein
MKMQRTLPPVAALAVAAAVVAGCGSSNSATTSSGSAAKQASANCPGTRPPADERKIPAISPDGGKAVHASTIKLTQQEIDKLKRSGRQYKIAYFTQAQDDNDRNMRAGILDTFKKYGLPISLSQEAVANWDAARQVDQVETLIKTKPDAMIGILVDQTAVASAIRDANRAHIPVVFWDVAAKGANYTGIVSSHGRVAGWKAADAMAKAIGCKGDVAVLPMKFKFFPTDQRVNGFLERIKTYPDIKVVAQQGATVFDDGEKAGEALLQRYPNLKGAFASWQEPAMGVISAARTLGKTNLAVTTVDIGEKPALELGTCGILKATVAQLPYDEGVGEALDVAKTLAGDQVPKYAVTDVPLVTHENVMQVYQQVYHMPPPAKLKGAYRPNC